MRDKFLLLLFLIILPITVSGCWDVEEINRKATVSALFLDTGKPGQVRLGAAFEVPGSLLPPYNGATQQFEKRVFTMTGEGKGMLDAWKDLQSNSSRDIFFGQVGAIVISTSLAQSTELPDALNYLGRTAEIPGNTYMMITLEDPSQLLDVQLKNNMLPGNYIQYYFDHPSRKSLAIPIQLWQVFRTLANRTGDVYLPFMELSQGMYKITGTALFSRKRMVGQLDSAETEILSLLLGSSDGYLTVPIDNGLIGFYHVRSNSRFKLFKDAAGKIVFKVNVKINGSLHENQPANEYITVSQMKRYEQEATRFTKQKIETLLAKLQQLNSDPLGFGEWVRVKYPDYWDRQDWHQTYLKVQFKVKTEFVNKTTGVFR